MPLYARVQSGRVIREFACDAAETFDPGALVLLAADEEVEECGADPGSVLGVALHAAGKHPEDDADETPSKVLVAVATEAGTFIFPASADVEASDEGVDYGAVNDSGVWKVDKSDETNIVFQVVRVLTDMNMLEVRFVKAVRQFTP